MFVCWAWDQASPWLSVFVTIHCSTSLGLWLDFLELTAQKGNSINHLSGLCFSRGVYNIAKVVTGAASPLRLVTVSIPHFIQASAQMSPLKRIKMAGPFPCHSLTTHLLYFFIAVTAIWNHFYFHFYFIPHQLQCEFYEDRDFFFLFTA